MILEFHKNNIKQCEVDVSAWTQAEIQELFDIQAGMGRELITDGNADGIKDLTDNFNY